MSKKTRGRPAYTPTADEESLLRRIESVVEEIEDTMLHRDSLLDELIASAIPASIIAKAAHMAPHTIAMLRMKRQLQEVNG